MTTAETTPPTSRQVDADLTAPGQLFETETVEIWGVPTRVWKNAPPTLRTVLELSQLHGDKTFVVYEDERYTFVDHFRQATRLANRLRDRFGVQKGDRVAIAMRRPRPPPPPTRGPTTSTSPTAWGRPSPSVTPRWSTTAAPRWAPASWVS